MNWRKIAGPIVIKSAADGTSASYPLPPKGGGRMVKTLLYFVKVISVSSSETEIGLDVKHGPEPGWMTTLKNDIIPFTVVSEGDVLEGAIGAAGSNDEVVGEVIQPSIKIQEDGTPTTQQTATIEIYEMRKPF